MVLVILVLYLQIGIPRNVKDYDKFFSDLRLVLENLKLKNNHKLVIGNLSINSISKKFDDLKLIMQDKVGILVITETKTDCTLPLNQFAIQRYSKPYRFDRNRDGGGILIYTPEDIEIIFIEINLIKTKWLFVAAIIHLASLAIRS